MDKAIGIINANYDTPDLKELINGRTAASVPFGGRFRMIDFALSNMVNAGITSVGIITIPRAGSVCRYHHGKRHSQYGLFRSHRAA